MFWYSLLDHAKHSIEKREIKRCIRIDVFFWLFLVTPSLKLIKNRWVHASLYVFHCHYQGITALVATTELWTKHSDGFDEAFQMSQQPGQEMCMGTHACSVDHGVEDTTCRKFSICELLLGDWTSFLQGGFVCVEKQTLCIGRYFVAKDPIYLAWYNHLSGCSPKVSFDKYEASMSKTKYSRRDYLTTFFEVCKLPKTKNEYNNFSTTLNCSPCSWL